MTTARSMLVDLKVGDHLTLEIAGEMVVVTLESKSGQRGRLRVKAAPDVRIRINQEHKEAAVQ